MVSSATGLRESMITTKHLRAISRERLRDARALLRARRFDGAYYTCGYAVELALKARSCRTLKWTDFPETPQDFRALQSFKTHDLAMLLRLSGVEARVNTRYVKEWSVVLKWRPEVRYRVVGHTTPEQAAEMVEYCERLLAFL